LIEIIELWRGTTGSGRSAVSHDPRCGRL